MYYTYRWTSRGSYRLISDRTCGKMTKWTNGMLQTFEETAMSGREIQVRILI
jgi:hypothetical protein